ncbi:MAG: response regulator [Burkholderiales bacterium]|nr:response regulator [Burkholderiales bacterium]
MPDPAEPTTAAPRRTGARAGRWLAGAHLSLPRPFWSALGLTLALALVATLALWQLRRDALDGQARELSLLSLALSDDIARGVHGAETGLRALRAELSSGQLSCSGAVAREALRSRASLMPLARALWLIDEQGQLLCASNDFLPPNPGMFAPSPHDLPDDALAISRPFDSPVTGEPLVALAVAYTPATDARRGWLVTALPARGLLGAFASAAAVPDARLAIFRRDGVLLAGSVVAAPTLDEARVAETLARQQQMELRRFRDGTERLVSLQTLDRYDLHVLITRNTEVALAPWREAAKLTAAAVVLILVIGLISARWVRRADDRQRAAQLALQAQQARAGKLESLGALAGGVAHDFNNVLASIIGYGEMAQDEAPPGSDLARYLDHVLQGALRGKQLVERILAFSRGGARASSAFVFEPIVDEVLTLLTASLRDGLVIERRLAAPDAYLCGDPTQAFEAVMNLCTNAMQAMPAGSDGHRIGVRLERVAVAEARVLSHSVLATGPYLALSVSDQGPGITPDVMERLFEPFFTTRAAQRGTGLGLAVVHGVVNEFGGAIDVGNLQPHGARFTLYLPECTDALALQLAGLPVAPAESDTVAATPREAADRPELLVVDDEPALVALAGELLGALGYRAACYRDPAAALQALRDEPTRYAALLSDEVMPGLTGTQLTQAARQINADLPVLLISAYGGTALAARAREAGVTRVLTKPLQRGELAQVLRDLLSPPAASR